MELLAGTSGYSYKEWKGNFYPRSSPPTEMLALLRRALPDGRDQQHVLSHAGGGHAVPLGRRGSDRFAFTLKAPRRITHDKRLREVGQDVAEFVRRAARSAPKLGPLLFQLPPFFRRISRSSPISRGDSSGPPDCLRVSSCHVEGRRGVAMLRGLDAMLCVADTDNGDSPPLVATSRFGYLRLRRVTYGERSCTPG